MCFKTACYRKPVDLQQIGGPDGPDAWCINQKAAM